MASDTDKKNPGPFGILLRRWRHVRGMSQLSLAHLSQTSPRHISFLETGRARPGRDLILEIAEALKLPPRDVNVLMVAAGFPHFYPEGELAASQDMAPFRALINNLVHGNARLPCAVVDRTWRIQDANRAFRALFHGLGWHFETPDVQDVVDRFLGDPNSSVIVNYAEVARQFIVRLRSEYSLDDDGSIQKLAEKAERRIKHDVDLSGSSLSSLPLTMRARYRFDDEIYSAVVGICRFGAAPHVELSELRLVWLIPEDAASEAILERLIAKFSDPDVDP